MLSVQVGYRQRSAGSYVLWVWHWTSVKNILLQIWLLNSQSVTLLCQEVYGRVLSVCVILLQYIWQTTSMNLGWQVGYNCKTVKRHRQLKMVIIKETKQTPCSSGIWPHFKLTPSFPLYGRYLLFSSIYLGSKWPSSYVVFFLLFPLSNPIFRDKWKAAYI